MNVIYKFELKGAFTIRKRYALSVSSGLSIANFTLIRNIERLCYTLSIKEGSLMSFELSPTASKKLTKIHGEIVADFQVTSLPEGPAPDEIKQAWLSEGLVIPTRKNLLSADTFFPGFPYYVDRRNYQTLDAYEFPVGVSVTEAVIALKNSGEDEAAQYWQKRYNVGAHAMLLFHLSEGVLHPRRQVEGLDDPTLDLSIRPESTLAPRENR